MANSICAFCVSEALLLQRRFDTLDRDLDLLLMYAIGGNDKVLLPKDDRVRTAMDVIKELREKLDEDKEADEG